MIKYRLDQECVEISKNESNNINYLGRNYIVANFIWVASLVLMS